MIDSDRIETILKDCLYRDEEIGGAGIPEDAVRTKGIVTDYGFHPQRLESHRDEIKAMLLELPDPFMRSKGGGWSFLNACLDRQGNQWTGLHQRMEQLFMLGEGLGLVTCIVPRALWPALPGGMPYYMVLDEVSPAADLTAEGMATDSER